MSDEREEFDFYAEFEQIERDHEIAERWTAWSGVRIGFALADLGGRLMLAILNEVHDVVVETRRTRATLEDIHETLKQMQVFGK